MKFLLQYIIITIFKKSIKKLINFIIILLKIIVLNNLAILKLFNLIKLRDEIYKI